MDLTGIAVDLSRASWRKSSFSGANSSNCVEVAHIPAGNAIAVRDSKNPHGPVLLFTPRNWTAFTQMLKGPAAVS